jgi:hypothetical protein
MLKKLLVAASLAAAAVLPSAAHAQDQWDQQVRTLISQAGKTFEDHGYRMTHQVMTGSLAAAADEMVQVTLEAGKQYQIMGVCDTDCSDMDLTLFDGAGTQVDTDVLADDVPIVTVTPTRSGTFRVKVAMVTCTNAPCRYGLGVFGK